MSALSRRLRKVIKTVSNGMPQQSWQFLTTASNGWQASSGGAVFSLINPPSTTGGWRYGWGSVARKADDGNFYYEIEISERNVASSDGLQIGIANTSGGTVQYMLTTRGTKLDTTATSTGQPYFDVTPPAASVFLINVGDVVGCSIKKNGADAEIRFYLNGVDKGIAFTVAGGSGIEYTPKFGGYLNTTARRAVFIKEDLKYKPIGFQAW